MLVCICSSVRYEFSVCGLKLGKFSVPALPYCLAWDFI